MLKRKNNMLYVCTADKRLVNNHAYMHECAVSLLVNGISCEYGISVSEKNISADENGKPFFPEYPHIHFSFSHCQGLAACYISESVCGCDAESIRCFSSGVIKRCFTQSEIAAAESCGDCMKGFTALWTLKEAYVKALGKGLSYGLRNACFTLQSDGIAINGKNNAGEFSFTELISPDGRYIVSVCRKDGKADADVFGWSRTLLPFDHI